VGGLERPNSLTEAFSGVDTLWLLTAAGPQAPHASSNALWAARGAGVSHIVRLSAIGAAHDAPNWGEGRVGLIDARDIAEFAARVLTRPDEHAGKTYTITGPARLSMADAASTLTDVLGKPVAAQEIPADAAVAAMTAAGFSGWVSEVAAREYSAAYAAGWGDYTTPDFVAVAGRPARTLADFARDHAAYLGGAPAVA